MIDYYYEQLNFTERRIYKSIYVSIVNKESYVYIAHIKKENLQILWVRCVNLHLQNLLGLDMQLLSFPRRWGYLFRRNMTRL